MWFTSRGFAQFYWHSLASSAWRFFLWIYLTRRQMSLIQKYFSTAYHRWPELYHYIYYGKTKYTHKLDDQVSFQKPSWSWIPINTPLCYLLYRMGFKQISRRNLTIIRPRKVLRAAVDKKPAFSTHRTNITEKANRKLNTLAEYKNTWA